MACLFYTALHTPEPVDCVTGALVSPLGPPAQFIGELVQLLLGPPQLRLQVLARGVELALQQFQLVCCVGEPFP